MDRRQVCAQVLQSSFLPQAIGFFPLASRTATYRHKRQIFTATSDWKEANAILPPQAIRPRNASPATQKQQSPAAVKKITCGSQNERKNERKNERFYCHKRLGNLTATSEVRAQGTLTCGSCPGTAAASCKSSAWRASCSCRCCWTYRIASGLVINRSGSKPIQDSISLFPVSWNLVIHFWRSIVPQFLCCTSWTAWNGIRTRFRHLWWNEVVEIFWSSWLRPWDPWAFLCLITSCIAEPLLPVCLQSWSTFLRF